MKKTVFAGCSFTAGVGWANKSPEESRRIAVKDSPFLWCNLCHNNINKLKSTELINIGQGGASNTEIFQSVVKIIGNYGNEIDTIFCQWTSMPRYNWNVGFELWNTSATFESSAIADVNLNRGSSWPKEYIKDLLDRFLVLHHVHWEILKIVEYSNALIQLVKQIGISNIFFINGLCPWDNQYFTELINVKPESYTNFTKKEILNIDTRNDEDILKLYQLAHQHYKDAGGIDESYWINLYDSYFNNRIDCNFDLKHPGVESNKIYYNLVNKKFTELGLV